MDFEIVIVNDDRRDKAINQPFPILLHTHIHITIFVQCEALREEQDKRELIKNRLNKDAYARASLPKKLWMCLQYIYWDIRGEKHMPEIPAHLRMEMARCLLPDIIAFCESDKGKAEIAQWKAEQAAKKEQSKAS